jgi:DNA-directed RNA polymerase specialized sigma24 family protein
MRFVAHSASFPTDVNKVLARFVVMALLQDHGEAILPCGRTWLGEGLAEAVTQGVCAAAWQGLPTYWPDVARRPWRFGSARQQGPPA